MAGPLFREGYGVELHPVEAEDHDFLATNFNRRDIRRMTNTVEPLSHDDLTDFLDSDETVVFLVRVDGASVGACWLFDRDAVHGRAELGYWITPDARRNGYATAAVSVLQEYAVDEQRLRKLFARVFEGNQPSRRVLEDVGFETEGRLRDHYYVDGEFLDAHLYGWLAEA